MHDQYHREHTDSQGDYGFDAAERRRAHVMPPRPRGRQLSGAAGPTKENVVERLITALSSASSRVALGAYVGVIFAIPAIGKFVTKVVLGIFLAGILFTLLMQYACAGMMARGAVPVAKPIAKHQ
jgi:hypothetical protein